MASVQDWNERSAGRLPGLLGIEVLHIEAGLVRARLDVRADLLAPNGYLHAATVVGLADTACGYGCLESLPAGATGFTTVELKSNHVGTVVEGALACEARLAHGGRTTQVWDATVRDEGSGRTVAIFRCTQLVLAGP
ncbi:MAG: PaaI family thioesterase [Acidimicrobiia bacterium]|nr:PaaI family thioesterase [Acidimicrobiia bacterium]